MQELFFRRFRLRPLFVQGLLATLVGVCLFGLAGTLIPLHQSTAYAATNDTLDIKGTWQGLLGIYLRTTGSVGYDTNIIITAVNGKTFSGRLELKDFDAKVTTVSTVIISGSTTSSTESAQTTLTFINTSTSTNPRTPEARSLLSKRCTYSATLSNGRMSGTWSCPDNAGPFGKFSMNKTASSESLCPTGTKLSGESWVNLFPADNTVNALNEPFKSSMRNFLSALSDAGVRLKLKGDKHGLTINSVYRPAERAYLMHYSTRITREGLDPRNIKPEKGIPICWKHSNADGTFNLQASRDAAKQMVLAYQITSKVAPVLHSEHEKRLAVDMNISWSGTLNIKNAKGTVISITTNPKTGMNPTLWDVGASYGVIKYCYGSITNKCKPNEDRPHWSSNGH